MTGLALSKDTKDLISLLARHKVRFLLVGGVAVIYHGYARLTGDIDFVYERTAANASRLFRSLREFWGGNVPFVDRAADLLKERTIIQFGTPPNRVDLMNSITGVEFKEAWASRIVERITVRDGEVELPIIGLASLEKNKRALGRFKDLADLEFIGPARNLSKKRL
jgi:hypothetical protein